MAGPHAALASIEVVPPPIPVDGTWSGGRGPISPVIVTRQQGKILTRFVVQAVRRTHQTGSGATPWRLLGRYDLGTASVTVAWACPGRPPALTSAAPPICPDLTLTTGTLTTINGTLKIAGLTAVDHTLAGDVSWTDTLYQS
jgi:hypothetical protein